MMANGSSGGSEENDCVHTQLEPGDLVSLSFPVSFAVHYEIPRHLNIETNWGTGIKLNISTKYWWMQVEVCPWDSVTPYSR